MNALHWIAGDGSARRNEMVTPTCRSRLGWQGIFLREVIMQDVTLIGIDLGKHSFHLHGQDRRGNMVFRRKVTR